MILATLSAFIRRDWAIAKTFRFQMVFGVIAQVLQLGTFFYLARMIDPGVSADIGGGGGYFDFVTVGLIIFGLATAGLTVFAFGVESERSSGSLEAMLTTPTPPALLVIGMASYSLFFSVFNSLTMLVAAIVLFGFEPQATGTTAVVAAVAFAATIVLIAAIGVLVAAFTLVVQRGSALLQFVSGGLSLFGGVYFTVDTLPEPLETIARILPFAWGLDIMRRSLDGERTEPGRLALLIVTALVAMPVALRVFEIALRAVRRRGTLSHF